jgi:hypothetical protein
VRQLRFLAPFLTLTLGTALYACSDDEGSSPDTKDSGAPDSSSDSGKKDGSVPPKDSGADTNSPEDSSTPEDAGADTSTKDANTSDAISDAGGDSNSGDGGLADAATFDAKVWVLRMGAANGTLTSASTAGFIEEYSLAGGAPIRTIALPTAAAGNNNPITFAGTATTEGALSRSFDGHFVTFAGYAAAPGLAAPGGTPSATTDGGAFTRRVVGRVDKDGTVDTTTLIEGAFSGKNVRGAASANGTAFWVSGVGVPASDAGTGDTSVHYVTLGSTGATTPILTAPPTMRQIHVFDGQLYVSSQSGAYNGVSAVGTGLPVTTVAAPTLITGSDTVKYSPYAFAAFDTDGTAGIDVIYVADDAALNNDAGFTGGVQKWVKGDAGTWAITATFTGFPAPEAGVAPAPRGLAAFRHDGVVTLVVTNTASELLKATDDGVTTPAFVKIASAPAGTAFRSVVPAPN